MAQTTSSLRLTYEGAAAILAAAVAKAADMGVPQCITVVDPGSDQRVEHYAERYAAGPR